MRSPAIKKIGLLSLYGLCLIWSPLYGNSEALLFPALLADGNLLVASRIVNLAGFAIAMATFSALGGKLKDATLPQPAIAAVIVVGVVGMVLGALAGMGVLPSACLCVGALARGLFYGALTVYWIDALIHLEGYLTGIAVSAALAMYALAGLAAMAASSASPALVTVLLALYPLFGAGGLIAVRAHEDMRKPVAQESVQIPLRTRCILYAANFVFGAMIGIPLGYFAYSSSFATVTAFIAMIFVLLAVFALFGGKTSANTIFRGIMLACALALSAISLIGPLSAMAACLASAILAPIVLYAIVVFTDTQARMRKPYWKVPGMCQTFAAFGMAASTLALHLVYPNGDMPPLQLLLATCLCMLFIASVFAPSSRSRVRPWGFSSLVPAETAEELAVRRCSELADGCNLTSREHEILQMLATGSSREDIAEAFVISPSTVKTHIRNAYAKLGVHSQAELMELIANA